MRNTRDTLGDRLTERLTRRSLLRRSARLAAGAGAVLLVGCGGEDDAPPAVEREAQPQPAPAAPAQETQEAQEAAAQQTQAPVVQAEPQQQEAAQAEPETQQQQAQQAQQTQQAAEQQSAAAQTTAEPAGRRRLVPNLPPGDYALEDPEFAALPGATAHWGVIEGAGYRIEVPDNWNGLLTLWAHGFTGLNEAGDGPSPELAFSMPERAAFLATGTAWACSTYRATGYVPGVGVDDLLLVKDRFAEVVSAPRQTVCMGASMGGATAQLMAQEFPEELDGAVALCGALGNIWVVDYLAAWHTLAMWFLGGPPQRLDAGGLIEWAQPLGVSDDEGNLQLSADGERFAAVIEQLTGGPRWGFREGLAAQWNTSFAVGALTWPGLIGAAPFGPGERIAASDAIPMDTTRFVYDAPGTELDAGRLNAEVVRVAADAGRRADPGVGAPSGRLEVPLLCMKTTGDLFTPIHLDRDYQRLVTEAGGADQLVMRAYRRAGHCTFNALEVAAAVAEFTLWLDEGVRPAGEDLGGDLAGAGAGFTVGWDAGDPLRG